MIILVFVLYNGSLYCIVYVSLSFVHFSFRRYKTFMNAIENDLNYTLYELYLIIF